MSRLNQILWNVAAAFLLVVTFSSCSKQSMSERDRRREQARVNNEIKKRELSRVAGRYFGVIKNSENRSEQRVVLELDVKEMPENAQEAGSPDAVLTPKLSGSVRFDYGEFSAEQQETIVFGMRQSEFDTKANRLNIVSSNESYKDLLFSLNSDGEVLKGTWTAPQSSTTGEASFVKVGSKRSNELDAQAAKALRGAYPGTLTLVQGQKIFRVALNLNTQPLPPDRMQLSGVFKIYGSTEDQFYSYPFNEAEFNPITGQFVVRNAALSLVGVVNDGRLSGEFSLAQFGKLGTFSVAKGATVNPGETLASAFPKAGTFIGQLSQNSNLKLPKNVSLNLVTVRDQDAVGGLRLSGHLRFYLGRYDGTEYVEAPFETLSFNPFTNEFVAKTTAETSLTVRGSFNDEQLSIHLLSDAVGAVGESTLKLGSLNQQTIPSRNLQGEYFGFLKVPREKLYYRSKILLNSRQIQGTGLRFTVTVLAYMGDYNSQEYLTYHFSDVAPNIQTNELVLKNENIDAYFKFSLDSFPTIKGQWGSSYIGDTGEVSLSDSIQPAPESPWKAVESVKGAFRGQLTNTHPSSNLPPRFELGLVTTRVESATGGEIRVAGSMRFYVGPFGSTEYHDEKFSDVQYNFFTREFNGTSENGGYVLKGKFDGDKFVGKLSQRTLGEVANIQLEKVTQ